MMPPLGTAVIFRFAAMFTLFLSGVRTSSAAIRGPTTMMEAEKVENTDVGEGGVAASSMLGRRLFVASSSPLLSVLIAHQPRSFEGSEPAVEQPEQRPFDYYDAIQEEDRRQQHALLEKQQQEQQQQFVVDGETAANDRLISIRRPVIVVEPAFPMAAGRRPFFAAFLPDMVRRLEAQQQQQPEEDVLFVIDNDSAAQSESRRQNAGVAPSFVDQPGRKFGAEKAEAATPKVSIVEDSAREEVDDDSESRNSKEEEEPKAEEKASKTIVGDSATEMAEVDTSTESASSPETEASATGASEEAEKVSSATEAPDVGLSDAEAPEATNAEANTEAPEVTAAEAKTEVPEVDTSADKTPKTVTSRMIDISSAESSSPSSFSASQTTTTETELPHMVNIESSEDAAKAVSADLPIPPISTRFVQRLMN